jgi:hypothetical protein
MIDWASFHQALLRVLPNATDDDLADVKYIIGSFCAPKAKLAFLLFCNPC